MGHLTEDNINLDESRVSQYHLPDLLIFPDGTKVSGPDAWVGQRRQQLLSLFEEEVYGKAPGRPNGFRVETTSVDRHALNGIAIRKEVSIHFTDSADTPVMNILVYLPKDHVDATPTFLGLNFSGNHTIHPDPDIKLTKRWIPNVGTSGVVNNQATDSARGVHSSRWPVEQILERGYALATIYCGDLILDRDDGFASGVHQLFYGEQQARPAADEWGALGAWAWGLSRAMDYLVSDRSYGEIALIGHSRLGKAALWAGAVDQRFALVISNNSGCGGAALSRRKFGETIEAINTRFPHWFCRNFHQYNDEESQLPVDQHMLIALMAPRPVYVASAEQDYWADPTGEFLSCLHASPAYHLFGSEGLLVESMPEVNCPTMGTIGYHIRPGGHDITAIDWAYYLDFADKHLKSNINLRK
jgi:hypothetical protein